jgi:hypothetical protein
MVTQAGKLGLKPGLRLGIVNRPDGWDLADPPAGLANADTSAGAGAGAGAVSADVLIAFFTDAAGMAAELPALAQRIYPDGAIWAAWPRRAGGHHSDITDNVVREIALPLGLVDVKVAAIDEDWSGLRLVWRVENRGRPLSADVPFLVRTGPLGHCRQLMASTVLATGAASRTLAVTTQNGRAMPAYD